MGINGNAGGYVPGPVKGAAGTTVSNLDIYSPVGASTVALGTWAGTSTGNVRMQPINIPVPLNAGVLDLAINATYQTIVNSTGNQTVGYQYGLYSQNGTALSQIVSGAWSFGLSVSNSSVTLNMPLTTNYTGYSYGTTGSAGLNITSNFTGAHIIGLPVNSYLSPGQYYLGQMQTQSFSGQNGGFSFSNLGVSVPSTMANPMPPDRSGNFRIYNRL